MIVSLHVHVVIIHGSDTHIRLLNSNIWHLIDKLAQAVSGSTWKNLIDFRLRWKFSWCTNIAIIDQFVKFSAQIDNWQPLFSILMKEFPKTDEYCVINNPKIISQLWPANLIGLYSWMGKQQKHAAQYQENTNPENHANDTKATRQLPAKLHRYRYFVCE